MGGGRSSCSWAVLRCSLQLVWVDVCTCMGNGHCTEKGMMMMMMMMEADPRFPSEGLDYELCCEC